MDDDDEGVLAPTVFPDNVEDITKVHRTNLVELRVVRLEDLLTFIEVTQHARRIFLILRATAVGATRLEELDVVVVHNIVDKDCHLLVLPAGDHYVLITFLITVLLIITFLILIIFLITFLLLRTSTIVLLHAPLPLGDDPFVALPRVELCARGVDQERGGLDEHVELELDFVQLFPVILDVLACEQFACLVQLLVAKWFGFGHERLRIILDEHVVRLSPKTLLLEGTISTTEVSPHPQVAILLQIAAKDVS